MQRTELQIRRSLSLVAAGLAAVYAARLLGTPEGRDPLPLAIYSVIVAGGLYFTWRTTQQLSGRKPPTERLLAFIEGAYYGLLTALLAGFIYRASTMTNDPAFPAEYGTYIWGLCFLAMVVAMVSLVETLLAWTRVIKRQERA